MINPQGIAHANAYAGLTDLYMPTQSHMQYGFQDLSEAELEELALRRLKRAVHKVSTTVKKVTPIVKKAVPIIKEGIQTYKDGKAVYDEYHTSTLLQDLSEAELEELAFRRIRRAVKKVTPIVKKAVPIVKKGIQVYKDGKAVYDDVNATILIL